jgi:glucosamine--fructose-6-phosphate aminotransferase (isomerizing)
MLKEMDEQPGAVRDTLGGRLNEEGLLHLDELAMSDEDVRGIEQVFIVACGSAYHSGLVGKYAIERWARIPVQVEMASEFRYRDPVLGRNTLVIAVSQSGETADTLEAVRHARARGPGSWRSPTRWARPSRASPTPPSTPAAARRSPSPPPRR